MNERPPSGPHQSPVVQDPSPFVATNGNDAKSVSLISLTKEKSCDEKKRFFDSFLDEIKSFEQQGKRNGKSKFNAFSKDDAFADHIKTPPPSPTLQGSCSVDHFDSAGHFFGLHPNGADPDFPASNGDQHSAAGRLSLPDIHSGSSPNNRLSLSEIVISSPFTNPSPLIVAPMAPTPNSSIANHLDNVMDSLHIPASVPSTSESSRTRNESITQILSSNGTSLSDIPMFTESDISKILAVPDLVLEDPSSGVPQDPFSNRGPAGPAENDALEAMALMSSPSKASEYLAAILSESQADAADEYPKRDCHPLELAGSSGSHLLPGITLPSFPSSTTDNSNFEHSIEASSSGAPPHDVEMVELFGFSLQRVTAPNLDPKQRYICISDIFQKFFKKHHWDEFKDILAKNRLTPLIANSLEVLSEEEVKTLLLKNQARKAGFVRCTALNSSSIPMQTIIEQPDEELPGTLPSGIRTRHGDHSDITYVGINGCTLPAVNFLGSQWVRLADVQGKVLGPAPTREGEQISPQLIMRLKQQCNKLKIKVEKIPQNVKFRLTARAQSCHSNSLHAVQTENLTQLVEYALKMEKRRQRLKRKNGGLKEEERSPIKKLKIKIPKFELGENLSGAEDNFELESYSEADSLSIRGSAPPTRSVTPSSSGGDSYGARTLSPRHYSPCLSLASEPSPQFSPYTFDNGMITTHDNRPIVIDSPKQLESSTSWPKHLRRNGSDLLSPVPARAALGSRSVPSPSTSSDFLLMMRSPLANDGMVPERSSIPPSHLIPKSPPPKPVFVPKSIPTRSVNASPDLLRRLDPLSKQKATACKPCFVPMRFGPTCRVMKTNQTGTRGLSGQYIDHLFQTPESPCILCQVCQKLFPIRQFIKHHDGNPLSNSRLHMYVPGPPITSDYTAWGCLLTKLRTFKMYDLIWELPEDLGEYQTQRVKKVIPRPSRAQLRVGVKICEGLAKNSKKSIAAIASTSKPEEPTARSVSPMSLEKAQRMEKNIRESTAGITWQPLEPVKPAQKQYRGDSYDMVYHRLTLKPNKVFFNPSDFLFGSKDGDREASIEALYGRKSH